MCLLCRNASVVLLALMLVACSREERRFSEGVMSASSGSPAPTLYQGNAFAISEGQRLYGWFNCSGCHAHGGGAIGPALMDDEWIYGGEPQQIYQTIVEGRPNGMPKFGGRVPEQQIWQLVAYVLSLSDRVPKDAKPVRSDHLYNRKPDS